MRLPTKETLQYWVALLTIVSTLGFSLPGCSIVDRVKGVFTITEPVEQKTPGNPFQGDDKTSRKTKELGKSLPLTSE